MASEVQDQLKSLKIAISKVERDASYIRRYPNATPMEIATLVQAEENLAAARRLVWSLQKD
jgi:hypothetical protein